MKKQAKQPVQKKAKTPWQWSDIVTLTKAYQPTYTGVVRHVGTAY